MDPGAIWDETKTALADAYRELIGFAIGAVEAIAVALVATFVARSLRRRVAGGLGRTPIDANVVALAANGVAVATYVVAITLVLALLGASWTALVAVLGASTVAISLALQDVLRSFVAGVYLLLERPFAIGDRIKVRDVEGTVEGIDIRTTALRTEADERVLVPNATVFAEVVTNRSVTGVDTTTLTLKGLDAPLATVPGAVAEAVAGADGLDGHAPTVDVVAASTEGVDVVVTVAHAAGVSPIPLLLARLRDRFPDASISIGRPS
ncbi:MAG: mechanosensitive ion channel family protein [Chloroflexota bacterium]|nr:mechanosensitive ion channel family protein [Chloroflexota bacterium]